MKPSKRLDRIPPYLFAELARKVAAKRAAGVDVISLGIGDPDRPTPAIVVDAMQEAVTEPETHRYPSNRGRRDFRAGVQDVSTGHRSSPRCASGSHGGSASRSCPSCC